MTHKLLRRLGAPALLPARRVAHLRCVRPHRPPPLTTAALPPPTRGAACSKGGRQWSDVAEFYEEHYGVGGHTDSALRMLDVALAAPEEDTKVGAVSWWELLRGLGLVGRLVGAACWPRGPANWAPRQR